MYWHFYISTTQINFPFFPICTKAVNHKVTVLQPKQHGVNIPQIDLSFPEYRGKRAHAHSSVSKSVICNLVSEEILAQVSSQTH